MGSWQKWPGSVAIGASGVVLWHAKGTDRWRARLARGRRGSRSGQVKDVRFPA
jgi:hypothetical protein